MSTHELSVHDIHFWWCKKSLKHVWNTNCAKLKATSHVICAAMVKNYGDTFVFSWFLLTSTKKKKLHIFVEYMDTMEVKWLMSFVAIGIFMSGRGLHYWEVEIHPARYSTSLCLWEAQSPQISRIYTKFIKVLKTKMSLEFIYNSKSCKSCFAYKDMHTCTKGAKLNEFHKYSQVFKLFSSFVV